MKQDRKLSRAGAATVKMVSYTPIIPCMHNPTACYPGEIPARRALLTCQKIGQMLKQLLLPPPAGFLVMQTVTPSGLQANPKCAVSGRGSRNTQLLRSTPLPSDLGAHGDSTAPRDSSQGLQGCLFRFVQARVSVHLS